MRNSALLVVLGLGASIMLPRPAAAQRHTLSGFVRDSLGHPIVDAVVFLDRTTQARMTRADGAGHFAFDTVSTGKHELTVLRIGYTSVTRGLNLPEGDVELAVTMHALPSALDTIVVSSSRLGLYGNVVALRFTDPSSPNRDFLQLPKADVQVIGSHPGSATTDSMGGFSFPNAKSGAYMLHVSRDGYAARTLSVSVPTDSGLRLAIVLEPGRSDERRMQTLMMDMRERVAMRGVKSAFLSHADLNFHEGESIEDALRTSPAFTSKALVLDPARTCVFVDGLPSTRPLSAIDASEVESVEVYGDRADRTGTLAWPRGGRCGDPSRMPEGNSSISTHTIAIWLRH